MIPWEELETLYESALTGASTGAPAIPFRVALGSQIIKESLNLTDEETAEQIRENPYLQYFIGYASFTDERPFNPSMMVYFRRRLEWKDLQTINERIVGIDKAKKAAKYRSK